ncbi:hypothetical protein F3087_44435 [Nocardia colli]|uniref:Uncharacterized protein n=1 Tax=Nocardia colli TaxID=2545717 RepID=A0A5N0DK01_9NOCA|nr:hypothetical protein [Nocardia colli]KAA8877358.1 hypothetical protein F3087_44435 [Nocardia colli]
MTPSQESSLRIAGSIPLVAATVALVLSVGACSDTSSDAGSTAAPATSTPVTPTVQSGTTQPPPLQAPSAEPVAISCGTGVFGLAVFAVTTKGSAACATAIAVTNAYGEQPATARRDVLTVTVEGGSWTCQERQGQVNPYQECVSKADPAEKVRLSS